jgi:DNA polymerase
MRHRPLRFSRCARRRAVQCGRIELKSTGAFPQLRLPSSRAISYPRPQIIVDDRGGYRVVFRQRPVNSRTAVTVRRLWRLVDRTSCSIARDLLTEAMLRIETAGYPIVLHVHDETVAEVPIGLAARKSSPN